MMSTSKNRVHVLCPGIPYRKDSRTGKIATGGIWASKSWKTPPAVAELVPDVTPT